MAVLKKFSERKAKLETLEKLIGHVSENGQKQPLPRLYKILTPPPKPLFFLYKCRPTFAPSNFQKMKRTNSARQIGTAAAIVLAVAAVCYPFSDWIGYRSVALFLLFAVSILAVRMSLAAVVVAAVLSALVWDFFFIPPHFTFTIGSGEDVLLLVMYFIVALLSGVINHHLRQLENLKKQKEDRENAIKLYNAIFDSLSHELRTPIAAILGAADILQENAASLSDFQKKELLAEISDGSLRLSEQVENLLNVSRIEAGVIVPKKSWVEVSDLIFGTLKKLERKSQQHKIQIALPDDFPLVQLDFGLTEQVLQNLLANAFRHTAAETEVFVSAKILNQVAGHFETNPESSENLEIVDDRRTHTLQIEVSDNGQGFSVAEIEQVFGKFYRPQHSKADGTGLGLFIVKGFVEAQGGEVSLSNRMGGGSKFVVEFPTKILDSAGK